LIVFRSLLNVLQLAVLVLPLCACAQLTYSAKEIHGTIVDADTGQPLEGVNIVAEWQIDRTTVGDENALLHLTETVTGKDGKYTLPAWGPIGLPLRADFGQGRDPLLSIFKSGYEPEYIQNDLVSDMRYRRTPVGEFKWNGATTKLKKWTGSTRDYWWRVGMMSGRLPVDNKAWKNYPRMSLSLIREQKRLTDLGAPMGLSGIPSQGLTPEDQLFLKRFEP
jgi:hypothetical protein